jgi:hypothetical protein
MDIVLEARTVQLDNSLALILPKGKGFAEKQIWLLVPLDDGEPGYTLTPKLKDPYVGKKKGSMYVPEEWPDFGYRNVE